MSGMRGNTPGARFPVGTVVTYSGTGVDYRGVPVNPDSDEVSLIEGVINGAPYEVPVEGDSAEITWLVWLPVFLWHSNEIVMIPESAVLSARQPEKRKP